MSKTISARLNEDEIEALNEIAAMEHLDRSALVRKFIIDQMKIYQMKKMGEFYRKGILSLQEAATASKVSLYEMMEYIDQEKISPPSPSVQEMEEEWAESHELFNQISNAPKTRPVPKKRKK